LVEGFEATGVEIFQNNGVDANQHYPHYHMHVVPRYPGSDPTRIYSEKQFEPISIEQQRDLCRKDLPCRRLTRRRIRGRLGSEARKDGLARYPAPALGPE
jgi:diadenosine tetraphosphate (Ap4A) HIT family hydrolase